jgi:hypothetical protein
MSYNFTKLFFQTFLYPPLPLQGGERKVPLINNPPTLHNPLPPLLRGMGQEGCIKRNNWKEKRGKFGSYFSSIYMKCMRYLPSNFTVINFSISSTKYQREICVLTTF